MPLARIAIRRNVQSRLGNVWTRQSNQSARSRSFTGHGIVMPTSLTTWSRALFRPTLFAATVCRMCAFASSHRST